MIKLQVQKNKNYIKRLRLSKFKNKSKLPNKVGVTKLYKYSLINYNLIILLQKYGLTISKGLQRIFLRNLIHS